MVNRINTFEIYKEEDIMDISKAEKILDMSIAKEIKKVYENKTKSSCFICSNESDMPNVEFYIEEHILKINKPICENCYDNVRYENINELEKEIYVNLDNEELTGEKFITGTEQNLFNVHSEDLCKGSYCCIHNPSDHKMKDFPLHWRSDRKIMERICEHGTGHPDPDDIRIVNGDDDGIHGCCGCCSK